MFELSTTVLKVDVTVINACLSQKRYSLSGLIARSEMTTPPTNGSNTLAATSNNDDVNQV